MNKRKICVVTGTRAEYGILRSVLKQIKQNKKLKLQLVVSGMHLSKKHGLSITEIENDGFFISRKIKMMPRGDTVFDMAKALGDGIKQYAESFKKIKPDICVILGDRDEALAAALAGSHMNIPIAHIHGGDKTQGCIDEYNRHAISKLSNIHFAATKKSMERILKMGENPKNVFNVGSPSIDEIKLGKISTKKELEKKMKIKFTGKEIILLYHPVTTESNNSCREIKTITKVLNKIKVPIIAIAPNSDAGNKAIFNQIIELTKKNNRVKMYKNLLRSDYLGLLNTCKILIGNSSSGIVEASYFDINVINLGIRQEGRERGKKIIEIKEISEKKIENAITKILNSNNNIINIKNKYGEGGASKKIVKILEEIKIDKKLIQKQIVY